MQMKSKTLLVLAAQDVQHVNSSTNPLKLVSNQDVEFDQCLKEMVLVLNVKTIPMCPPD